MSENLMKWLRFAIELEDKGLQFYKECLLKTKNQRATALFDYLVKAEKGHKAVLTDLLNAVSKGDRDAMNRSIEEFIMIEVKIPMFEKEEIKDMTEKDMLTKIFNKAMEFEEQGLKLYIDLAKKEDDPVVKKLFIKLANDETTHRKEIKDIGHYMLDVSPPDGVI